MLITPGIIQTVLGNGQEGWGGDGGPALQAACQTPYMCAFDTQGNMFVCMGRHHRIRRMDATTGMIALVAGTGESGYSGDGGPALHATFNMPYALTVDTNGDIYVAERGNPIVRKIDGTTGRITTLAGTGEWGYSGDGGPATRAMLREPNDVCLDGKGGLLDGRDAGARGCTVDQHGAGAALTEPAPELRTVQPERIAQDIEERLGGIPGLDSGGTAVDLQSVLRHRVSPCVRQIHCWQLRYSAPLSISTMAWSGTRSGQGGSHYSL